MVKGCFNKYVTKNKLMTQYVDHINVVLFNHP